MVRLKGERVLIRPLRLDDLDALFTGRITLAEHGHLDAYPDREQLRSRLPQWGRLRDGRINLGIEVDGCLVGEIQTFPNRHASSAVHEVGVSFYDVADRGKGLGTEAVRLLVTWLFGEGVERVQGRTSATNHAMRRVFERIGFVRVDHGGGLDREDVLYQLTRADARGTGAVD